MEDDTLPLQMRVKSKCCLCIVKEKCQNYTYNEVSYFQCRIQKMKKAKVTYYYSKYGTKWSKTQKKGNGERLSAEKIYILRARGGVTAFIKHRVDNSKDVFFELLGQETLAKI